MGKNIVFNIYDWTYIDMVADTTPNALDWDYLSEYQHPPEWFIEKHQDSIIWFSASEIQDFSDEFLKKYRHKIQWDRYCYGHPDKLLDDIFIEKFEQYLDWRTISEMFLSGSQILSESMIGKYANRLVWGWVKTSMPSYSEELQVEMQMKGYYNSDL